MSSAVAVAAFNLNVRMRADHDGPLFRVRNGMTGAQTDIRPRSDGTVDRASLETACKAGDDFVDCFVVTVYDQSGGGNDVTQAAPPQQPQIANPSGLMTDGDAGFLAAQWDGVDDRLFHGDTGGLSGDCTVGISMLLSEELDEESFPAMVGAISLRGAFGLSRSNRSGVPPRHSVSIVDRWRQYRTDGPYVDIGTYQHNDGRRVAGSGVDSSSFFVNGEELGSDESNDADLLDMGGTGITWGDVPEMFDTFRARIRSSSLVVWSAPTEGADKTAFDAWMASQL
jgi:hypothetical protein